MHTMGHTGQRRRYLTLKGIEGSQVTLACFFSSILVDGSLYLPCVLTTTYYNRTLHFPQLENGCEFGWLGLQLRSLFGSNKPRINFMHDQIQVGDLFSASRSLPATSSSYPSGSTKVPYGVKHILEQCQPRATH